MSLFKNENFALKAANRKLMDDLAEERAVSESLRERLDKATSKPREPLAKGTVQFDTQWGNNIFIVPNDFALKPQVNTQWGSNFVFIIKRGDVNEVARKLYENIEECKVSIEMFTRYDWELRDLSSETIPELTKRTMKN